MAMEGRYRRGRGEMAGNAAEAVTSAINDKATLEDGSTASWLRREKAATARNYAHLESWSRPRNIKPPCGGFTGQEVLPYSRDVRRGDVKIAAWRCAVNLPALRLGNSGRGNYAQRILKPTPGQSACGRAAYRREARMTAGEPVKSSRQRMAPTVIISARLALGVPMSRYRADSPTVIGL